jgi:glycosyltransferase involved in cell wall biosynthesis
MTTINPAVSVVVPVRNEAGNIAPLVTEIADALNGQWVFEVVYVDDGSKDGTGAELVQLMQQHAWLRRIHHKQSCGQSAAVRTGVTAARAPIVVTLDGDGQNDPAFIPELVRTLEQGMPSMGLVAGQRVGRKASGFKKLQSRIANLVRGAVLRDGTRDTGCGLEGANDYSMKPPQNIVGRFRRRKDKYGVRKPQKSYSASARLECCA